MGNPKRKAAEAAEKKWAADARQQVVTYVEHHTIPVHLRVKVLRFALYAEGVVSMLTPHSVYLSHMLVREHMRREMYGSQQEASQ
jgi:hypothetical protein